MGCEPEFALPLVPSAALFDNHKEVSQGMGSGGERFRIALC